MSKIEDAVVDFLTNKGTFYAALLSQMQRIADKQTPTLHVEIKNGRVEMHYNPDFVDPRTMKDTKALLEHECLHIVMEHFTRFKGKDMGVAKVATDLAINQMLPHIPKDAIRIEHIFEHNHHKIGRNEAAEYYYNEIMKDKKAKEKCQDLTGDGGCKGDCKPDPNGDPNGKGHPHACGNNFDKGEGEAGTDQELQKEIVKQMVKEAADTARKNGQGHLPAGLDQYLEELFRPPEVSWRQLLRKFVAASIKSGRKPSWKKESRRFGEIQKGRVADRTVSLVVAIDTSGSIDDTMLTDFITEIKAIQSCYKSDIHVIECDAEVQKYYKLAKYAKVDRNVKGRGGTDFAPVFRYVKRHNIRCDALIFFTDLQGSFPSKKPPYPVIWGYYNYGWGGVGKAPFGHVITLKQEKKK